MFKVLNLIVILIVIGMATIYVWLGLNWDGGLRWWMLISYVAVIGLAYLISRWILNLGFSNKVVDEKK